MDIWIKVTVPQPGKMCYAVSHDDPLSLLFTNAIISSHISHNFFIFIAVSQFLLELRSNYTISPVSLDLQWAAYSAPCCMILELQAAWQLHNMSVPGEGHKPKTLSLVVTPYKKSCTPHDRRYKRCGASKHCIRWVSYNILYIKYMFSSSFLLFAVFSNTYREWPLTVSKCLFYYCFCYRSELFCDGTVNCAVNTKVPQGK